MKQLIVSILFIASFFNSISQQTIKVMQYNLLYYGEITSFCTATNNNVDDKDVHLKTIVDFVQPDIFCVNELGESFSGLENIYGKRILDSIMNTNGVTHYEKALHTGSNLVNMIYYNSEIFGLVDQEVITKDLQGNNLVRLIDVYSLYYKDPDLAQHQDTVFLTCIVGHLKAGSTQQVEREDAAKAIMDYLDKIGTKGNRLLMGDFNLEGASEGAFDQFTNHSNGNIVFEDPAGMVGEWSSNFDYRMVHTQSVRDNTVNGDCPVGGGMDDRFDFILASKPIMLNSDRVKYVSGSHTVIGQDGSFYNTELNTVTNSSVPANVATALYNMSDHLPVSLELEFGITTGNEELVSSLFKISYTNPFSETLNITITEGEVKDGIITIVNVRGTKVLEERMQTDKVRIDTSNLSKGVYVLSIQNGMSITSYKVIKL